MAKDGGIVGVGTGQIISCYNVGKVYIEYGNSNIGGIVGALYEEGKVENCYNLGEISGAKYSAGGIVGLNQGDSINKCYNLGVVKGDSQVGGIAGANYSEVKDSYSIIGGKSDSGSFGAIAGSNNNLGKISNCYYSEDMPAIGEGNGEVTNVKKLNSQNMPSVMSVINANNDFKEDTNDINNGYPILEWQ